MKKGNLFVVIFVAVSLWLSVSVFAGSSGWTVVNPKPAPGPLDNPIKGWAPYPHMEIYQPYSMVCFYVPWSELEPKEGDYRFEEWEKKTWYTPRAVGKRIIWRLYVDYPTMPHGMPQWLIDKGVKMTLHDGQGGGTSPDYNDPAFVAAAEKLIAAMGKRYNSNPRAAFVPLSLLGFWGEWHTWPYTQMFASDDTQKRIIDAYRKAFPDKMLLVRYAQGYAGTCDWIGFHDDSFPEDTDGPVGWEFLPKMRNTKRTENWKTAPIGGEMIPQLGPKCLGENWNKTLDVMKRAHFSWVGPYCPALDKPDKFYTERCAEMVRTMGYEYRITSFEHQANLKRGDAINIRLKGVNQGIAPFYYPWCLEFAFLDDNDTPLQIHRNSADIRKWLPGTFCVDDKFIIDIEPGYYRIAIGIRDPWKNRPGIRFANDLPLADGWTVVSRIKVL